MIRRHHLIGAALVLVIGLPNTSAVAAIPPLPQTTNSGPAKSMFRDIQSLTFGLKSSCVKDDPDKFDRWITEYQTKAAAFTDAQDRDVWTRYVSALRAHHQAHLAGVPGLGSYAELHAKHATLAAEIAALAPTAKEMPADVEGATQLAIALAAYKAKRAEAVAFWAQLEPKTHCFKHTGDWQRLAKDASDGDREVASLVSSLIRDEANAINAWASNVPQFIAGGAKPGWWGQTHYAGSVLEALGKVQKLLPRLEALLVLAPLSSDLNHELVPKHVATAKEFVAKHMPLARKLVGEAMIPKGVADGKRLGVLKKMLAANDTGKQVGKSSVTKVQSETYTEFDGGRRYTVVKKTFGSYYVWKPITSKIAMPSIDGIAPEELCELWAQGFFLYDQGGPSRRPLKTWRGGEGVFISAMKCANKDKLSPHPLK